MIMFKQKTTFLFLLLLPISSTDHFLGGTVSWRSVANFTNVLDLKYKLSYTVNGAFSPYCKQIGAEVKSLTTQSKWQCLKGCNNPNQILNPPNFKCLMVDKNNNFQQFGSTFTSFFIDGNTRKTIGFAGNAWRDLNIPKSSGAIVKKQLPWNIQTRVDTRRRSDTHLPNNSPETLSRPMYDLWLNHSSQIRLPVIDADGDEVRCRWATIAECGGSCYTLPGAKLNGCTLSLKPTTARHYVAGGWYLVALMLEDWPRRSGVRLDGDATGVRSAPLSSVPLQFLLRVLPPHGAANRPLLLSPPDGARFQIKIGETFQVDLQAQSQVLGARITKFTVQGPQGLTQGNVTKLNSTVAYTRVNYTPAPGSSEEAVVCFTASDSRNANSDTNCVTMITVSIDHCKSAPCLNGGQCINHQLSYSCQCSKTFSGYNCELLKTTISQRTTSSFTFPKAGTSRTPKSKVQGVTTKKIVAPSKTFKKAPQQHTRPTVPAPTFTMIPVVTPPPPLRRTSIPQTSSAHQSTFLVRERSGFFYKQLFWLYVLVALLAALCLSCGCLAFFGCRRTRRRPEKNTWDGIPVLTWLCELRRSDKTFKSESDLSLTQMSSLSGRSRNSFRPSW